MKKYKDDKTFCYYCQDDLATETRNIPLRRSNGYKLMDFEAKLCKGCNCLSDKFLSDYFSI